MYDQHRNPRKERYHKVGRLTNQVEELGTPWFSCVKSSKDPVLRYFWDPQSNWLFLNCLKHLSSVHSVTLMSDGMFEPACLRWPLPNIAGHCQSSSTAGRLHKCQMDSGEQDLATRASSCYESKILLREQALQELFSICTIASSGWICTGSDREITPT